MPRLNHSTLLFAGAGALGGAAAWPLVTALSSESSGGLLTELSLGAMAGIFIGGFLWSHETLPGRQFRAAVRRAGFGAAIGMLGGAAGAVLGSTLFSALGRIVVEAAGISAPLGIALAVGLGWSILGAAVGLSGGLMIRSRDRAVYGLCGGAFGGLLGGLIFYHLSATSIWSALAGLALLGMSIGAFISLVEEAFVSAKVKIVKGRHLGREFGLLKDLNVVGRDDRSDVCLSGAEGVGMRHAVIKKKNGRYSIEADENGSPLYVNQQLTRGTKLADGDVIRVGSILLLFSAVRKAAAAASIVLALFFGMNLQGGEEALAGLPASARITQFDLSGFPVVRAYLSLLDQDGHPIRGLRAPAASLIENGRAIPITHMQMAGSGVSNEALAVALVLDTSGSMAGTKIARAKESLVKFLSLMDARDRAALLSFNDQVTELVPLGGGAEELHRSVAAVRPDGHTALYDAIARGVSSLHGVAGRRAVIVLTDGIANRGLVSLEQSLEAASKAYVSVSVIGLGEDVRTARLERIAQETGGSYFFAPAADDLAAIYEAISRRIKNEYVITYTTEKRGEYLRKVSFALPGGPETERTYFQPQSSLFGAGGDMPPWAYLISLMGFMGLVGMSFRKAEQRYATGHLSLVRGRGTRKDIDIGATVTIGRDARNTLGLLKDNGIGEQHAEVLKENGQYLIEDRGSAAGTFVNKQRVTGRQVLKDGDVIDVGNATIVFSEGTGMACPACGSARRPGAKFCQNCGKKN